MSRLTLRRLRLFAILVALAVAAGVFIGYQSFGPEGPDNPNALYHEAFNWFVGASLFLGFELFLYPSRHGAPLRRMHFMATIAVKSIILACIVVFATFFGRAVLHDAITLAFLAQPEFYRVLGAAFLVVTVVQASIQIMRIIGSRTLVNFVFGRYRRPIREDRIFMFLDLADSTALAERLGDIGVQTLITQFFFDITEPIIEYGGEIHRYVGDQVVITWPLRAEAPNMRSIRCYFAIPERVGEKAAEYQAQFGTVPAFRAGLHGGPVVISECGDYKQEISYFGDTVNTAARVQQQCKVFDCPLLVSAELLDRVALPRSYEALAKGSVQLRGWERETDLFTILPAGEAAP